MNSKAYIWWLFQEKLYSSQLILFVHKKLFAFCILGCPNSYIQTRLRVTLNILQMKNFSEYCSFIKSDAGEYERSKMLNALTTNVTRFFREAHHFEILKARILPKLIAHAMSGGQVRIWSAACSSGEEAYSIALSILDLLPNAAAYDIRILASDIDGDVLEKARKGRYSQEDIEPISEIHRR